MKKEEQVPVKNKKTSIEQVGINPNSDAVVFYHGGDIDGKLSALIAKKYFKECVAIPIDRPDEDYDAVFRLLKEHGITDTLGKVFIMVDYSLKDPADFQKVSKHFDSSLIIDHHKTAIAAYDSFMQTSKQCDFNAVFVDGVAACQIIFQTLFENEDIPGSVKLAAIYDVAPSEERNGYLWDSKVMPFQMGIRTEIDERLKKERVDILKNNDYLVDLVVNKGQIILQYQKQSEDRMKSSVFFGTITMPDVDFTHKVMAIATPGNSEIFKDMDTQDAEFYVRYIYDGKSYKYTLYAIPGKPFDVSVVAKAFGGGGHAGAAGFIIDKHLL